MDAPQLVIAVCAASISALFRWVFADGIRSPVVVDGAGFEFDDDPGRIDVDAVWSFLSQDAYWGRWRSRADVEQQIASAWRVVGCYHRDDGLVGFARAISDGVALAYLADVFVIEAHRGHGLGQGLVKTMIDDGPGAKFRWLLHTADAHDVYRPFGFAEPDHTLMERPARIT